MGWRRPPSTPSTPGWSRPPTPATRPVAAERVRFAAEVREEVERRKRPRRLFTYDDMLTRLRDALADPAHGAAAAQRLRDRYRIVLVDEFQDTDPIQWEIIRRAFHGHRTLILIGDPKQAIYAFRGADVYSYLDAVQQADQVRTLGTNWRSDEALVDALDTLLGGAALGDERIVVRPVRAAPRGSPADGAPADDRSAAAPVRLRIWPHTPRRRTGPGGRDDPAADPGRPGRRRDRAAGLRPAADLGRGPRGRSRRPTSPSWSARTSAARRSGTHWSRRGCRP